MTHMFWHLFKRLVDACDVFILEAMVITETQRLHTLGHEGLNLLMVDDRIPAGAKLY